MVNIVWFTLSPIIMELENRAVEHEFSFENCHFLLALFLEEEEFDKKQMACFS